MCQPPQIPGMRGIIVLLLVHFSAWRALSPGTPRSPASFTFSISTRTARVDADLEIGLSLANGNQLRIHADEGMARAFELLAHQLAGLLGAESIDRGVGLKVEIDAWSWRLHFQSPQLQRVFRLQTEYHVDGLRALHRLDTDVGVSSRAPQRLHVVAELPDVERLTLLRLQRDWRNAA